MRDIRIDLFDIVPYLEDKGISFVTEGPDVTSGWIGLNCLWCSDHSHHLGIHLASNAVTCWRCGKHSAVSLIRVLENNCRYSEALEVMEKYQNISRIQQLPLRESHQTKKFEIPKYFKKLVWPDVPQIIQKFLIGRGFDPETIIRSKELFFGGIIGDFRYRIILPVYFRQRIVSVLGRSLGKNAVPYRNLEDDKSVIPIKSTLYGYDDCPPGGTIVVVEGPFDQWKLGPGSVATYGTAWTIEQVSLLRELKPNKINILYDTEEEAQQQADKLMKMIHFCDCSTFYLEGLKDPGELTLEEGKKLMEELK